MSESQRKYAFVVGLVSCMALLGVELWQHALAFEFELATTAAINAGRDMTPAPVVMRDLTNLWFIALGLLSPSTIAQGAGLLGSRLSFMAPRPVPVVDEQPSADEAPEP